MSMNKLVELLTQNIIQRGGADSKEDDEEKNGFKGFLYHLFLYKPTIQFGTYIKNISWLVLFVYLLMNIVIYAVVAFLIYLFYYLAFVGYPKWIVDLFSFSISNIIEIDKLLEDNNLLYNSLNVLKSGKSINSKNSKNSSAINAYDVCRFLYGGDSIFSNLKFNVNELDNFINTHYSQYNEKKYTVALREFYLFYYKLYDKKNVRDLSKTTPDDINRIIDSTDNSSDLTQPIRIDGQDKIITHFQFYKALTDYKIYNKTFDTKQTTGNGKKSPDQCLWEVYSEDQSKKFEAYKYYLSIKETNNYIRQNLKEMYNIINANNYIVYLTLPSSERDITKISTDYTKYMQNNETKFEELNEYSWILIEVLNYYNNKNNYTNLTTKIGIKYDNIETLQNNIYNDFKNSSNYSSFDETLKTKIKELNTNPDNFDININKIINILQVYISRDGSGSYLDLLQKIKVNIDKIKNMKKYSYYINLSKDEKGALLLANDKENFGLNIAINTTVIINKNPIFSHIYFNQHINDDTKANYYKQIMDLYIYLMSGGQNTIDVTKTNDLITNLSNLGGDYKDFVNSVNIANLYFNVYFKDIVDMVKKPYATTENFFYELWTPFYKDIIMNRIVHAFGKCFKDSWAGNAFVNKNSLEPPNYVNYIYKYTFIQDTMTSVVKNTWSRLFTSSTITPPAAPEEVSLET